MIIPPRGIYYSLAEACNINDFMIILSKSDTIYYLKKTGIGLLNQFSAILGISVRSALLRNS